MRLLGDEAGVPRAVTRAAERHAARVRATLGAERVHTRIGYEHPDSLVAYPDAFNLSG